jgi:hypothetical protein
MDKALRKLNPDKWKGYCGEAFDSPGSKSVDEYIGDVRGVCNSQPGSARIDRTVAIVISNVICCNGDSTKPRER